MGTGRAVVGPYEKSLWVQGELLEGTVHRFAEARGYGNRCWSFAWLAGVRVVICKCEDFICLLIGITGSGGTAVGIFRLLTPMIITGIR